MTAPVGDGYPRVLLPGMNCSARLWTAVDVGSAIIPVLTESSLTAQVDRLLDELPPRFALAGLSLGGIVAAALARVAPERVTWLGLLSTNPYAPTDQQREGWLRERDRLAGGTTARQVQCDLLPLLLSADSLELRLDVVDAALIMADEVGEAALDAQLALQATRIDERQGLRDVRCPTLVLAARHDRLCPVDRHREIAALVPGAELQILEHAAHLSPLERPVAVTEALAGSLAGAVRR